MRIFVMLAVALALTIGGFLIDGSLAKAQTRRHPSAEWADMGEADGVRVYRFSDGNRTCYVTTPGGGVSCL